MKSVSIKHIVGFIILFLVLMILYVFMYKNTETVVYSREGVEKEQENKTKEEKVKKFELPKLDKVDYDNRLLELSHYKPPVPILVMSTSTNSEGLVVENYSTTTPPSPLIYSANTNVTIMDKLWPKSQPYPFSGAILPFHRILAYYGNFYSVNMGILGEFEEDEVIRRLMEEKANWEAADPNTPVMPAIEHIAMVAQGSAGEDGMYRSMMPEDHIERAYEMAKKIDGIVIYDLQIGLSTVQRELPKFKKYLERPEVHIALDPEFSMKSGDKPGTVIGTSSSDDINYMINYMSDIVKEHKLPPKVLLIHRFTQNMVTGYDQIKPTPEVQVVVVMDGWGSKDLKRGTYWHVIEPEPIQFAGVKIFYKNDLKEPSTGIFTPQDVLNLYPKPIYVQYQ